MKTGMSVFMNENTVIAEQGQQAKLFSVGLAEQMMVDLPDRTQSGYSRQMRGL